MHMRRLLECVVLVTSVAGCAGQPPPFSRVVPDVPKTADGEAKLVFLWPPDSCEGGGFQTVVTRDGRFVGNIARGTRLETGLRPGTYDFLTWNAEKERAGNPPSVDRVGLLHVEVDSGATYFARLAFGEWDLRGPTQLWSTRGRRGVPTRRCVDSDAALVRLVPTSSRWPRLHDWLDELTPIAADVDSGQRWLEQQPWPVAAHRELADAREAQLTPYARELVTLAPGDGVRIVP